LTAISLLNSGCIAFHPESAAKDDLGFYRKHYRSCGVDAIRDAKSNFGERATYKNISQEIQKSGNISRSLLSLFHHDSFMITWPCEIKKYLNNHGYTIEKIDDFNSLKKGDVAIVLVKGASLSQDWHWMCYPNDKNIKTHFGEKTEIIQVYLLKKIQKTF